MAYADQKYSLGANSPLKSNPPCDKLKNLQFVTEYNLKIFPAGQHSFPKYIPSATWFQMFDLSILFQMMNLSGSAASFSGIYGAYFQRDCGRACVSEPAEPAESEEVRKNVYFFWRMLTKNIHSAQIHASNQIPPVVSKKTYNL